MKASKARKISTKHIDLGTSFMPDEPMSYLMAIIKERAKSCQFDVIVDAQSEERKTRLQRLGYAILPIEKWRGPKKWLISW